MNENDQKDNNIELEKQVEKKSTISTKKAKPRVQHARPTNEHTLKS